MRYFTQSTSVRWAEGLLPVYARTYVPEPNVFYPEYGLLLGTPYTLSRSTKPF